MLILRRHQNSACRHKDFHDLTERDNIIPNTVFGDSTRERSAPLASKWPVLAVLVLITTITTGQHYFIDSVGGVSLAWMAFYLSGLLIHKRSL